MTKPRSKPARKLARRPDWPSPEQRTNALINSAKATRDRYQRQPAEIDWDAAITRLKAMLDRIDGQ